MASMVPPARRPRSRPGLGGGSTTTGDDDGHGRHRFMASEVMAGNSISKTAGTVRLAGQLLLRPEPLLSKCPILSILLFASFLKRQSFDPV